MKISTEKMPESQILMTIEVESERLDDAREKALRKLSPRAKVPGFRPGKAPAAMVRRYFGEERILDEALDALVPLVYREAVQSDESIDPIARPRLVVETTEPLVVKATIPVRPTIELGDYGAVRVKVEPVVVEDSRVEETLTLLRKRAATLEPIERELAWDDIARINLKGAVGEEPLVEQQDAEIQLMESRDVLFPGFEEALIGHKKGETVEFDLDVPAEAMSEKFAGKQAHFVVAISETKEEVLPELDDDFTKQIGEGYETVDALRDRIREDVRKNLEEQRNNRYHDEILNELVDRATIEFPPVMAEVEVDRMLHDQAGHIEQGKDLESYLAGIGKTEDEVRAELRPVAEIRLRRSLVLSEVTDAEHIEVSDEEIAAEIEKMTSSAGPQGAQLQQLFGTDEARGTIRRNLLTRKTLARLVEIATQDGPDAEATGEMEKPAQVAAPTKKRRTKAASKMAAVDSADEIGATTTETAPAATAIAEE